MEITIEILTNDDLLMLQVLLEKCSDYLTFQDEEPVKLSEAQDLFKARPDGVVDKDKVIFGIFNDQKQLVGVFDLIKSFSGQRTLSLGLMLIDPVSRRQGIGNKAYNLLEEWAIYKQFNKVRLGVLFGNEKGLRFWKSMGYTSTEEVRTQMRPNLSKQVMVFEKSIGVSDTK